MQIDNVEKNKVKLTFSVDAERFEEGMKYSYNKNKSKINIPGFRKGKIPRKMVEMQYGEGFFYDDAINFVLKDAYEIALKDSGIDSVSKPEIDVVECSTEKGVIFTAEIFVKPEVTISGYKGLTYVKTDIAVTKEEIQQKIDTDREKNSRIITVSDRAIKDKDITTIDFKGFVDDVPFEGGEGKDFELTIGSKSFIDNFEEQLIGHNIGDDVTVNVTFPEEYMEENLQGKDAKFEVEIKDIKVKELPEINDEFAQDVSEFDTLAEYKENIKSEIEKGKTNEATNKKENEVMQKAIGIAEMDVPEVMIETQIDQQIQDFTNRVKAQGLPMEMYLKYMNQTIESMREVYRVNAESQVKGRLVLEKIAELENFDVSDEEFGEEIQKMATAYGIDEETLKKSMREEILDDLKKDIKVRKALKYLSENAIEIESDPTIELEAK